MKEILTDEQMGVQGRVSGINTKKIVREAIVLKMVEKKQQPRMGQYGTLELKR